MAKSRSIPTDLLSDPDYMELDSDTQVILLMLVLTADDEGRGRAHTGMLARHFNKPLERIEHALAQLSELELITRYAVGRHHYYQLLRWWDWQTLSKPTPSRFPLPPAKAQPNASAPCSPRETQENPGESWPEGEGKGREEKQNRSKKQKATCPLALRDSLIFHHQPQTFMVQVGLRYLRRQCLLCMMPRYLLSRLMDRVH